MIFIMYTANTSRGGLSKILRFLFVILLLILVAGGGFWAYRHFVSKPAVAVAGYPKYISFAGDYVFSIPKGYVLDDQSLPGIQLLYTGKITVKDLTDAYNANAIAVQAITDLADKKGDDFKKKINDAFVPELKKISPDVKIKFVSEDGTEVARITVSKDGKPARFVYVRSGKHPVQVVAKQETDTVKAIVQTTVDVESSELKTETKPVQEAIRTVAQLIKDQNATELYKQLAPEFKVKNTETDLKQALEKAATYTKGGMIVSGAAYKVNPSEMTVVFSMPPPNQESKLTSGVLYLTKTSGDWKVKGLNLPSPASEASAAPAKKP